MVGFEQSLRSIARQQRIAQDALELRRSILRRSVARLRESTRQRDASGAVHTRELDHQRIGFESKRLFVGTIILGIDLAARLLTRSLRAQEYGDSIIKIRSIRKEQKKFTRP